MTDMRIAMLRRCSSTAVLAYLAASVLGTPRGETFETIKLGLPALWGIVK